MVELFNLPGKRVRQISSHVIVHTPPSPVILCIDLGGKPKWLLLSFEYHDAMHAGHMGNRKSRRKAFFYLLVWKMRKKCFCFFSCFVLNTGLWNLLSYNDVQQLVLCLISILETVSVENREISKISTVLSYLTSGGPKIHVDFLFTTHTPAGGPKIHVHFFFTTDHHTCFTKRQDWQTSRLLNLCCQWFHDWCRSSGNFKHVLSFLQVFLQELSRRSDCGSHYFHLVEKVRSFFYRNLRHKEGLHKAGLLLSALRGSCRKKNDCLFVDIMNFSSRRNKIMWQS